MDNATAETEAVTQGEAEKSAQDASTASAAGVSEQAAHIGNSVRDAAGRASRAVGEGYDCVAEQARDTYQKGRDAARELTDGLGSSIKQRPLIAVLIAAVFGCLLGFLFIGRKKD